jgi:precorrin-4 methylase
MKSIAQNGHEWGCPCRTCYKARKAKNEPTLRRMLRDVLNKCSAENGSNTADIILADFLVGCLEAFDKATNQRTEMGGSS